MSNSAASVEKFYKGVIDDVIASVREVFLDDGMDDQVLEEIKQTWTKKLNDTKVLQHNANSDSATAPSTGANSQQQASNSSSSSGNVQAQQQSVILSTGSQKSISQANKQQALIPQADGPNDSSDEEDEEDEFRDNDDDHEDNDEDQNDEDAEEGVGEEEPLNSGDDVSDEDPTELFDTDNVVVCQYDKITRSRNKWKFHLKDGIMNLKGKDYVFQKAVGDAEW